VEETEKGKYLADEVGEGSKFMQWTLEGSSFTGH